MFTFQYIIVLSDPQCITGVSAPVIIIEILCDIVKQLFQAMGDGSAA